MDQWEAEGQFPAHKIFKLLGNAGFLGVNKPVGKEVFTAVAVGGRWNAGVPAEATGAIRLQRSQPSLLGRGSSAGCLVCLYRTIAGVEPPTIDIDRVEDLIAGVGGGGD